MKKSALIIVALLGMHTSAFATQSTVIKGHGSDGCALVQVTHIQTNPVNARGKCFCKDMAVDKIMLNRPVSCSLFCVGSPNQPGQAFSCTATASKPSVASSDSGASKSTLSNLSSAVKKVASSKSDATTKRATQGNQKKAVQDSDDDFDRLADMKSSKVSGDSKDDSKPDSKGNSDLTPVTPSSNNLQAIAPPSFQVGGDCTTGGGQKGTYGPSGACLGTINPSQDISSVNQDINSDYVRDYNEALVKDRNGVSANLNSRQNAMKNGGVYVPTTSKESGEVRNNTLDAGTYGDRDGDGVYSKAEKKQDKKDFKNDQKVAKQLSGETDILNKNNGDYGGKYGGANVETTNTINTGVKVVSSVASQLATNAATNQNTGVMNNYSQLGSAATQKQYNNSQADMLENSAKMNQKLGLATVVMSALQGTRVGAHLSSKSKVNTTYSNATARADAAWAEAQKNYAANKAICMSQGSNASNCLANEKEKWLDAKALYQSQMNNADNNSTAELNEQNNAAGKQTVETATTAAQAAMMLGQAASLKKAANAIRNQATADISNPFTFNPGAATPVPTPDTGAVTTDPGTVVADDSVPTGDLANNDMLNPNIADPGAGGPAPGEFKQGAAGGASGGGGMGMGSVGGTSAAKDDGAKPETAALAKSESGKYSAGEGTGSRFARGGSGGSGVGVDSGFADLLKKFLPGADEGQKKNHDLAFDNDRSPASDQAAVLGRNQNIFEAIHKRYQKKHNEGAIVFVGDQG